MPEERRYRRDRQRNKEKKNQDDGKKIILAKKEPSTASSNTLNTQPKLLLKPKDVTKEETSQEIESAKPNESSLNIQSVESPQMKESVKLLGSDFVFNIEPIATFIQEQSNDFLVVAFVGPQNSGKSTLANLLLNVDPDINEKIFKTRSRQCVTQIGPITKGIDLYISKERVIVLDCAPILSNISYKDFISSELDDLRTLSFLLSICNIIVIVQEKYVNPNVARLVLAAEMMRTRNPLNTTDEENLAQIMFIENKVQKESLDVRHIAKMKSMYKTIFQCSNINHFLMNSSKADVKNTIENVNFVAFPEMKEVNQSTVKNSINNFRKRILMTKRYTTKYHQGTQFNEKMWLQSLIKIWETQSNNYFFKKYGNLKEKFNLLNHVSINDGLKYDKNMYYPDE